MREQDGGPWRRAVAAAEALDRATPPSRDRGIDALRGGALCCIVLGHWLVSALVLWGDGGLRIASPLRDLPQFTPLSWVLQVLAVFFAVGGYVSALSLARARDRGESIAAWLRSRTGRLARPVLLCLAVWGVIALSLTAAVAPLETVRTGMVLVLQPLWFIAVFIALVALTPVALAADRRLGLAAPALLLAAVAAVDLARYGPWAEAVPGWVGLFNLLFGWLLAYQLGTAWANGRIGRALAWAGVAGGAVLLAVLVGVLDYPASAVGVPGVERDNLNPPSLLAAALALVQVGGAVLARPRLAALLRRPVPWAAVAGVNLSALTIFCWHQTALFSVTLAGSAAGVVPGLTSAPDDPGWAAVRLAWLPVFAAVLVPLVAALRRYEEPWTGRALDAWPARIAVVVLAGLYGGFALLLW